MGSTDRSGKTSADDFLERLKTLATAHVVGSNKLLTRFGEFVEHASKSVVANPTPQQMDAQAMLSRWLEFNLASYSVIVTNGLTLFNGLLSAAEATLIPKPAATTNVAEPASSRVQLRLSGRRGERTTSGFVIENNLDQPLKVTFECGDLTPETGASLPGSYVTFEPATLAIPPRSQGVVQAAVSITAEFVVGQTYTTAIRLLGSEEKSVGLAITVLSAAGASEPRGADAKRGKSAKKRRARG